MSRGRAAISASIMTLTDAPAGRDFSSTTAVFPARTVIAASGVELDPTVETRTSWMYPPSGDSRFRRIASSKFVLPSQGSAFRS